MSVNFILGQHIFFFYISLLKLPSKDILALKIQSNGNN